MTYTKKQIEQGFKDWYSSIDCAEDPLEDAKILLSHIFDKPFKKLVNNHVDELISNDKTIIERLEVIEKKLGI